MTNALDSIYVIDGLTRALTPRMLLLGEAKAGGHQQIVDETIESCLASRKFDASQIDSCLEAVKSQNREFPVSYAGEYTESLVARALLDAIWRKGHFCLGNLSLNLRWFWNDRKLGNMAAFYHSVEAVSELADSLGVRIGSAEVAESETLDLKIEIGLQPSGKDEDSFVEEPFKASRPVLEDGQKEHTLANDPSGWLIYIPFDNSEYHLGASLLSQALRFGGTAPRPVDPDYFMDCYEVVRELVEDGVVLSGTTVGEGGLLPSVSRMTAGGAGCSVDISDALRSSGAADAVHLLFAEVPGVLIQIRDADFDYVDAELLLQDVAYYPLGHPEAGAQLRVNCSAKTGVQSILESLIQNQSCEGED